MRVCSTCGERAIVLSQIDDDFPLLLPPQPHAAEAVILDYLNSSNRPYSAINIHDNLHGIIAKAVIPKLLDNLADRCVLV